MNHLDPSASTLTPGEMLEIAHSMGSADRSMLASRTDLTHEVQERLAIDPNPWVRRALALNPSLGLESMKALERGSDAAARHRLALNTALPLELQELFALDPDVVARAYLAANPALSPHLQDALSGSEELMVREYLAGSRALTLEMQLRLSRDHEFSVRDGLLRNESLHPSVAEMLLHDGLEVRYLCELPLGTGYLTARTAHLDPEAYAVLAKDWTGTLGELIAACEAFAPGSREGSYRDL